MTVALARSPEIGHAVTGVDEDAASVEIATPTATHGPEATTTTWRRS
jgi:hypothetical protein